MLYVELIKALYGTLQAALIFWQKLTTKPIKWGSKSIHIIGVVDDNAPSPESILNHLNTDFGHIGLLVVHHGKIHDYLGMILDSSQEGAVKISMIDSICKMSEELPPDMDGTATIPAVGHLFQGNSHPAILSS